MALTISIKNKKSMYVNIIGDLENFLIPHITIIHIDESKAMQTNRSHTNQNSLVY
jgi:hypothetical protein